MKKNFTLNEEVSRLREMMDITGQERQDIPLDELSPELRKRAYDGAANDYNDNEKRTKNQMFNKKRGQQADTFNTHVDPAVQKEVNIIVSMLTQTMNRGEYLAKISPQLGNGFAEIYFYPVDNGHSSGYHKGTDGRIALKVTKQGDEIHTEASVAQNVQRRMANLIRLMQQQQIA